MNPTNAEILDIVRRLRTYMAALDNTHLVLNGLTSVEDAIIRTTVSDIVPDVLTTSKKISNALKLIEASKSYRDMLKKFNIKEEDDERNEE